MNVFIRICTHIAHLQLRALRATSVYVPIRALDDVMRDLVNPLLHSRSRQTQLHIPLRCRCAGSGCVDEILAAFIVDANIPAQKRTTLPLPSEFPRQILSMTRTSGPFSPEQVFQAEYMYRRISILGWKRPFSEPNVQCQIEFRSERLRNNIEWLSLAEQYFSLDNLTENTEKVTKKS